MTIFCSKCIIQLNVTVRMELFIYFQCTINSLSFYKINNIISKSLALTHSNNYKDSILSEY